MTCRPRVLVGNQIRQYRWWSPPKMESAVTWECRLTPSAHVTSDNGSAETSDKRSAEREQEVRHERTSSRCGGRCRAGVARRLRDRAAPTATPPIAIALATMAIALATTAIALATAMRRATAITRRRSSSASALAGTVIGGSGSGVNYLYEAREAARFRARDHIIRRQAQQWAPPLDWRSTFV